MIFSVVSERPLPIPATYQRLVDVHFNFFNIISFLSVNIRISNIKLYNLLSTLILWYHFHNELLLFKLYHHQFTFDKSREVIHAFIKREIESFQDLLDPYFVWLGDYSNQYIRGKEAFLETIKLESSLPPLDISQEEYAVLTHEKKTWITYGRFTVNAHGKDRELYSSKIHFTFVWKEDKDGLFLLHVNACHVIDAQQQLEEAMQARVFDQIPTDTFMREAIQKIQIKDINGNVHFLFPEEIIYFRSDDKLTTCFNKYGNFVARTTLREQEHPHFVRIHSKYLVNISFIKEIYRYKAILLDDTVLPIGKERYKDIQNIIGIHK